MITDFDKIKNNTLVICFSSGHTSALMTKKILKELECRPALYPFLVDGILKNAKCHISKYNRYVFVVFNNTSREDEESLIFADKCDKEWGFGVNWLQAEINPKGKGPTARLVSFEIAARKWEVFEQFVIKHGLPQPGKRKCTEVLKEQNTSSFIRQLGLKKAYLAIGIRIDEPHRHKWEKALKNRVIWPLTTIWQTTKFEVIHFFNNNHFRLNIPSYGGNCKDCHVKGLRKLLTIAKNTPEKLTDTIIYEELYENHIPEGHNLNGTIKTPIKMHRDYLSTADILEMAQTEDFEPAIDESNLIGYNQSKDEYLDAHEECGESCDAFA